MDTAAFESVWNSIKEKYSSEVQAGLFLHLTPSMKASASLTLRLSWCQAVADTPAPTETPREEISEPIPDNDSEQYPEDDIPDEEEEDDDDDEDDDPDDGDYKVNPLNFSINLQNNFSSLF